ncbi:hypothetical protein GCM10008940_20950 [Microbulbifer agarilyticus]
MRHNAQISFSRRGSQNARQLIAHSGTMTHTIHVTGWLITNQKIDWQTGRRTDRHMDIAYE